MAGSQRISGVRVDGTRSLGSLCFSLLLSTGPPYSKYLDGSFPDRFRISQELRLEIQILDSGTTRTVQFKSVDPQYVQDIEGHDRFTNGVAGCELRLKTTAEDVAGAIYNTKAACICSRLTALCAGTLHARDIVCYVYMYFLLAKTKPSVDFWDQFHTLAARQV